MIDPFLAGNGEYSAEDKKVQFHGLKEVVDVLIDVGFPPIFHLKYDVVDLHAFNALLVVKMSDVCIVFPLLHKLQRDDVETAIWGSKDVDLKHDIHSDRRLESLHARLPGAGHVMEGEHAALVHDVTNPRALPAKIHVTRAHVAIVERGSATFHVVELGVDLGHDVLNVRQLEPLNARLQVADQVAFEFAEGEHATLVHAAVGTDTRALPTNLHVIRAHDAIVEQESATFHVVELGRDKDADLRHDVLDVRRLEPLNARLQGADQVVFEVQHFGIAEGEHAALDHTFVANNRCRFLSDTFAALALACPPRVMRGGRNLQDA